MIFLLRYKNSFPKIAVNNFSLKKMEFRVFSTRALYISGVWRNFEDLKPVLKSTEQGDANNCNYIRLLRWFHVFNAQQRQVSVFRHVGVIGLKARRLADHHPWKTPRHRKVQRHRRHQREGESVAATLLHLPKIIYVLFPTWLFCVYSVIFIYMYYLCSLLSAGISTE